MNLQEQSKAVGRAEPFTVEQNDEVYKRVMAGDIGARDAMIEGNLALVVYRVDAYLRIAPQMSFYRDDMISAGLLGLCQAVDGMPRKRLIAKPTGYICKVIDREISHTVDESNTIVVPFQVQAIARAEGKPIEPPKTVSDKALATYDDTSFLDEQGAAELTEDILMCCQTNTEKRIVTMRLDGCTDEEIGAALGLTHIHRLRKAIFKRFNERCPEFKETERAKKKRLEKEAKAASKKAAKKAAKEAAGG